MASKGIGHKRFKDSEIGRIPEDWELVRLGDESIAEIRGNKTINGFERVAFIPMESVSDSDIYAKYEVRPMEEVKSFTYCEAGDLLLAKITPSLENGKQGMVPNGIPNGFALATTEVFPISCKNIDRLFLFYVLKNPIFRNKIMASMTGTTGRQRATKISVKNLKIPLPPLPEQRKIAEILSTVDDAIQKVGDAITKTERLKQGLMQELLTKGIGHERFKDSEVGKIPEGWRVVRLVHANAGVIDGDRGVNYPNQPDFSDKGFCLFLNAKNVTENGFKFIETQFISKEKDYKMGKGKLKRYDIVLTTRGTIGNVGYYDDSAPYEHIRINSGMVILRNENKNIDNKFLYLLFRTPFLKTQIKRVAYGTAQPQLNVRIIKNFRIILPPFSEQQKIAQILSTVDKKLKLENKRKEKLERVKRGSMNDLLTGKKRVKT